MGFVVREAVAAGMGVEAASLLELQGALAAGCPGGTFSFWETNPNRWLVGG